MSNKNNESISFVVDKVLPTKYRAIIYPVLVATAFILWIAGKFTTDELSMWLSNIAWALGFGGTSLAAANRPQTIIEKEH